MRRHAVVGSIEASGNSSSLLRRVLLVFAIAALAVVATASSASGSSYTAPATVSEVLSGSARVSTTLDTEGDEFTFGYLVYQAYPPGPQSWLIAATYEFHAISEPVELNYKISGLKANTKYVAKYQGSGETNTVEFTTLPADPPVVISLGTPSEITRDTALIPASVERPVGSDPNFDAICNLEYISDADFNLGRNEKFKYRVVNGISGPGTYTLLVNSPGEPAETTAALAWNASAAAVQSALEAVAVIGPGAVDVTGGAGEYEVEYVGPLGNQNIAIGVEINAAGLGEGANWGLETVTEGRLPESYEGASKTACTPPVVSTPGVSSVTIGLKGLSPNTAYHYHLIVSNSGGSELAESPTLFTTKPTPVAQTLGVGALGSTSANLGGKVNPSNSSGVTYQFEWGLTTAYGNLAPAAAASLPFSDDSFHGVKAPIGGLQPSTEYHYRLLATNTQTGETSQGSDRTFATLPAVGPQTCPNESSRIGFSAGLPDCRAIEWATPDINNINISTGELPTNAAADGSAIQYWTNDAPEIANASSITSPIVSERGSGGWSTRSAGALSPEAAVSFGAIGAEGLISANLKESLFYSTNALFPGHVPGELNLFKRRADGSAVPLTTVGEDIGFGKPGQYDYSVGEARASEDFSHIFFNNSPRQLPEDPLARYNTYDWSEEDGLELLGILPAEGSTPETPAPNGAIVSEGSLPASSRDGTRVLFKARVSSEGQLMPSLYLRIDGEETVEVTAPAPGAPDSGPPKNVHTVGITPDGSTVYFLSSSELTPDANTGNGKGADLYSYEVGSGALTDLTVDTNPEDEAGAGVMFVGGTKDVRGSLPYVTKDGSTIYLVATGVLAPGATSGEPNLYALRGGQARFVAPAKAMGATGGQSFMKGFYATPDGDYAAFVSTDNLAGYDTNKFEEVFKFTYGSGSIECASCRPSGEPPADSSRLSFLPMQPRAISEDGSVFFTSRDALLPGLTNGLARVYEYSQGSLSLLSPAEADMPVNFLDASVSGDDVFVGTYEELVPGAGHNFGMYDIRVNADTFKPAPPECQGEGCRGAGTKASAGSAVGSATFQAPGELIAPTTKSAQSKTLKLRIGVPVGGQLTVSGKGIKKAKKTVAKAGAVTVTVSLTQAANKKRLEKGVYRTTAKVQFKPQAGSQATAASVPVVKLTFRGPAKKKGGK